MNKEKLTLKEKTEITIQTGLQLVPYVGGALSTAYFSTKQEKRFKRIESFCEELADKINRLQVQFVPFESHDVESLTSLIEELFDKIEKEHSNQKREYFKQFFINALKTPTKENNFDERHIFLEALAHMTVLEFELLLLYYFEISKNSPGMDLPEADLDVITGATARLKMFGLLESKYFSLGEMMHAKESINISGFGVKFLNFCLE